MADMPKYNYIANSKNVIHTLNNSIYYVNIFKILPSFKICNGFAMRLYLEPFWHVCHAYKRNNQISESRCLKMVFSHVNCGNFLLHIVRGGGGDLLTESDKPWCKILPMLPSWAINKFFNSRK